MVLVMSEMLSFTEEILHCRGGGAVQRCHGVRHTGSYSVAEHSWGVAMLLWYLFPHDFKRLVIFALCHDVPECLVGDVPSTVKENCKHQVLEDLINQQFGLPPLSLLGQREHAMLKICDRLDLYLWAQEQLASGNQYSKEIINNLEHTFSAEGAFSYQEDHWVQAETLYRKVQAQGVVPDRVHLLKRIKEHHGIL